ncbi:signal recognition particle subunit srp68 [Dipsacomyces acuminosporus]|nr:signal recognition particle subunit srp68 [Dipsacomyces acuminosporus]
MTSSGISVTNSDGAARSKIAFDVFGYIHDSRQTYGLRAQDYTRYRRYCAHRLQRVRKSVKLTQGAATAFRKKEVTDENASKPEHVEILILEAERAWAFAMDLREQYSRTEEPRQRYHLVRRLKAASKAARRLATISATACDIRTSLAAYSYWLQLQSQTDFELEKWEAALDCSVFSRVISERLAMAGTSQQYALAHALMETLDPIVRLAAYQARLTGAQQSHPADITKQWYETMMLANPERAEASIPGYVSLAATLASFSSGAGDSATAGEYERLCTAALKWRGGQVAFANQDLASLIDTAQGALGTAMQSSFGNAANASTAFKQVEKMAQKCYAEGAAASAKVQSSASDALSSAYLAIQLYAICALHSIAIAKFKLQAHAITDRLGLGPSNAEAFFQSCQSVWFSGKSNCTSHQPTKKPDAPRARGKYEAVASLPDAAKLVVIDDAIRKTLRNLNVLASDTLAKMSPSTSRAIGGSQIIEDISAAEAYYGCLRNLHSAALHASPGHAKYLDALALLDTTLSTSIPQASAAAASRSKHEYPAAEGLPVDELWTRQFSVSTEDVSLIESSTLAATRVVRSLCVASGSALAASAISDWRSDPSAGPAMVANKLLPASSKHASDAPSCVPALADLSKVEFCAVPVKPLFYDLASSAVGFDMHAINERAGKQSTSKLGSIIGSLWGSR